MQRKNKLYDIMKEGIKMTAFTKPINKINVIQREESRDFVKKFNNNRVSVEFLNSCKKAGKLFGKTK